MEENKARQVKARRVGKGGKLLIDFLKLEINKSI